MLPLNDIEQEIIVLACRGKKNVEIATIVGKSPSTVAGHLRVIYPKLDAHNRAEACANFAKMTVPK